MNVLFLSLLKSVILLLSFYPALGLGSYMWNLVLSGIMFQMVVLAIGVKNGIRLAVWYKSRGLFDNIDRMYRLKHFDYSSWVYTWFVL